MESGATVPQTHCAAADGAGMPPHSWSHVTAEKFLVRQGPNYLKTKRKAKSGGSFYEVRGVDWYRADKKVDGVGSLVDLPEPEFSHPSVPSLLVVNVQLPMEVGGWLVLKMF